MRFDHIAHRVPDIAEAVDWWGRHVPGTRVVYQDATWALVDADGTRVAFVTADQHPDHVAFRVGAAELERAAAEHGVPIDTHRDGTRGIYVRGPGTLCLEIITYPGDAS